MIFNLRPWTQRRNTPIDNPTPTPVETLGLIAARCDVFSAWRDIPVSERRDLERRAAAYRLQQLIELDREDKLNT